MKRYETAATLSLLIPPSLVLGLYVYIGSFNRMLADDYCSMYIGGRLGLLRSIWYWYRTWHGGVSASAADWLFSVMGPRALPFHTFVFLSLWVLFAALAAKTALRFRGYRKLHFAVSLLLAVLLVFTTLGLSPKLTESLFWWGGARGYVSPLILFTLYVAFYFYVEASAASGWYSRLWILLSFGLAFLIGGFSETFTPAFVVLLAGMIGIMTLVSGLHLNDARLLFLSAGLAGALISLFVMVLAPGNSVRQAYFPVPPDVLTVLKVSFTSFLVFLANIVGNPFRLVTWLGSVLGFIWVGLRINQDSGRGTPDARWLGLVLLAGFLLTFGCFPPAVYGTSEPPPERTLIIPTFFLVGASLASGFGFGEWLAGKAKVGWAFSSGLLILACSLVLLASYSEFFQKLYPMRAEHITFARKWDQVDATIRDAKAAGLAEVQIPSMKNWAGTEYPTDNPKYWPNICYSNFYDINVVAPPLQPE